MKELLQGFLRDVAPLALVYCAVVLGLVLRELERANRYLRHLSVAASRQAGEDIATWSDPGR